MLDKAGISKLILAFRQRGETQRISLWVIWEEWGPADGTLKRASRAKTNNRSVGKDVANNRPQNLSVCMANLVGVGDEGGGGCRVWVGHHRGHVTQKWSVEHSINDIHRDRTYIGHAWWYNAVMLRPWPVANGTIIWYHMAQRPFLLLLCSYFFSVGDNSNLIGAFSIMRPVVW